MSVIKKLASQTAVYGISTIVGRLINYLLVPLYTAVFLPDEYGVVTEMYAYVAFFGVILTYGMETSYFRFALEHDPAKVYNTAIRSLMSSTLIITVLGLFFSENAAAFIGYPNHPEYISWFILILAFDTLSALPFARLRQNNKAGKFAAVKMMNIMTNVGLNLFFLVLCPYLLKSGISSELKDIIGLVYNENVGVGYIFISNLIASLVTLLFLLPELKGIFGGFDGALLKKMMAYALPLVVVGFAGMINETLDRALLKHLLPEETALRELGIYGACYKLSILITLFIQAFRFAAEPFFFAHSKEKDSREIYGTVMNYFVIVCCVIFLVITLYLDIVKHFIRNDEYHEGLHVVPVLLMANIFLGIYYNLSVWYKLANKTNLGAAISLGGALLTVILNLALIPVFGYTGSAWATLACYFSMAVANYFAGKKHYHIPYPIKKIVAYLLVTALLYFTGSLLVKNLNPVFKFPLNTLLIILFAGFVIILERPEKNTKFAGLKN